MDEVEHIVVKSEVDIEPEIITISSPMREKIYRTKPKVRQEWKDECIFKLIKCVEKEPCIWNTSGKDYHNKLARERAWEEIRVKLGRRYTKSEICAKWSNLRIQYRGYSTRAQTKLKLFKNTSVLPKWKYFRSMAFVDSVEDPLQPQPTLSNCEMEDDSVAPPRSDVSASTVPARVSRSPSRSRTMSQSDSEQLMRTVKEAASAIKERQNHNDPNVSFTKYMISELQALHPADAAKIRYKIAQYFVECLQEVETHATH